MKKRFFFILTLIICSCSEDFLETKEFNENSENYFNKADDYNKALIGVYSALYPTYLNVMVAEIASDNALCGGESATDVPGLQQIDDMIHTPVNEQLRSIWQWMYAGINRANFIMEFKDKTDFSGKDQLIAEVRFLRSYFYFELIKFFGDVPLSVDKRLLFGDESVIDRTPKTEVYAQIEKDLLAAIEVLPDTQADLGRATKGAAQALLGKAYLYQDKFDQAADVLGELVLTNRYQLHSDFSILFEQEGENSSESVFEIQYTDNTNGDGASFDCLQCSPGNIAVGFNGVRNFVDTSDTFDSGFSFNVPTQELFQAYTATDKRKFVTILDIEKHVEENPGSSYATGFEHTGYYNRKYIARKGDKNLGDQNLTNPNNYRAIRYADVLLMLAESLSRGDKNKDEAKALVYLNQVRQRAGLNNLNLVGAPLIEQIYLERRLELAGEGHRFFDLVRTGKAAENMLGSDKQGAFQLNKHELFPIPSIEIELTGNRWNQNNGY